MAFLFSMGISVTESASVYGAISTPSYPTCAAYSNTLSMGHPSNNSLQIETFIGFPPAIAFQCAQAFRVGIRSGDQGEGSSAAIELVPLPSPSDSYCQPSPTPHVVPGSETWR